MAIVAYSASLVVALPIMLISICMTPAAALLKPSPVIYINSLVTLCNDQKSIVKSCVSDTVAKTPIALLFAKLPQFLRQHLV